MVHGSEIGEWARHSAITSTVCFLGDKTMMPNNIINK